MGTAESKSLKVLSTKNITILGKSADKKTTSSSSTCTAGTSTCTTTTSGTGSKTYPVLLTIPEEPPVAAVSQPVKAGVSSKKCQESMDHNRGTIYMPLKKCRLVQKYWLNLISQGFQKMAIQILIKFFVTYPEYRNFYPQLRSKGENEIISRETNRQELKILRDTADMRHLACTYMETLTTIINNLENPEELMGILNQLVDQHLPRGVYNIHFQHFYQTLQAFLEEKMAIEDSNTPLKQAWCKVLEVLTRITEERFMKLQHKTHSIKTN